MPVPPPSDADRLHSPAAERNRGPILDALRRLLPPRGTALEIAAGTGQHAAHFAAGLPGWRWQPTDGEAAALASIAAWCSGLPNVLPPLRLDVTALRWSGVPAAVDAVYCANMVHIAPWAACVGLMRGVAGCLAPQGLLILYGPYLEDGVPTAESNLAFDADLRSRDPAWGLRRRADVEDEARRAAGLELQERIALPSNNLLLAFARPR